MKWISFVLSSAVAVGGMLVYPSTGTAQTTRQNAEAHQLFLDGRVLFDDGNYPDAEKKFREALSKYPKADQADRTAYYWIDTLIRLGRVQDARKEIENFHRSYPTSRWRQDVDERSLTLGRIGLDEEERKIAIQRAEAQLRGSTDLPPNASMQAEALRALIQSSPARGIEAARTMLRADPSDPAVVFNLGTIYASNSPQALPFLLDLWTNPAASPNAQTTAFYFAMRRNPDKEKVAGILMDMLAAKKENEAVVNEALFRMTFQEHRAVLDKIVWSSNPDKFAAIDKIYRGGSITLRTDLLMALGKLPESRALNFIVEAAQSDKDLSVRRAALDILRSRRDAAGVNALENILKSGPRTPLPVPPPVPVQR